jgi:predicted transcriptional regulator
MFSFIERTTLETEVEETDTQYGFTWIHVDNKYRLRTPEKQFKEVSRVVIDVLKEKSSDTPITELIAKTNEQDSEAANVLQKMHEKGFVREGAPIKRIRPPNDIRLWHRALGVALLLCLTGVLWLHALSTLVQPISGNSIRYLLDAVPIAIPLIFCSVVVHEFGHHHTAWKQGLDPSFGISVINGVIPTAVTRTHGGWCLPRNRRMWNTLAGPAYGLIWTFGIFALHYTVVPSQTLVFAGVFCFNLQMYALIPLFHGDGYLLMTDFLEQQNLRTQGIKDLQDRRVTWSATYAALSYGFAIIGLILSLLVGYHIGDGLGVGLTLGIIVAIYVESYFEILNRLRKVFSAIR